jgi:hypothetical protein
MPGYGEPGTHLIHELWGSTGTAPMRLTILLAIVLTIAFATAGFVERRAPVITATGTTKPTSTVTSPTGVAGIGGLSGAPHANPLSVHSFDPLAQTLGTSSTALLAVELQRLMRTW